MEYFIVNISGKQVYFKWSKWYDIDFIKKAYLGSYIWFKKILLYRQYNRIQVGTPLLKNAKVIGKILQNIKGKKITVLKTKPKKNYTRIKGYRHLYTRIQLEEP